VDRGTIRLEENVTQTLNPPAHMLIDGTWLPSVSGRTFSVEDPSVRGRVIAEVARGDGDDVERAVAAAAAAFRTWR
jgi:acyl-CoA reductase-like NAD-dependent aldehyde dehydrogenase